MSISESLVKKNIVTYNSELKRKLELHAKEIKECEKYLYNLEVYIKDVKSNLTNYVNYQHNDNFRRSVSSILPENMSIGNRKLLDEDKQISLNKVCSEKFSDFEIYEFNPRRSSLSFSVRSVVNYKNPHANIAFEKDFGVIVFIIDSVGARPHCDPLKDNKPLDSGQFHPHISKTGQLCLGGYENQYFLDLEQRDFANIIYNVCSIIQLYNPQDAFHGADISLWLGAKCPICYKFIEKQDLVKCAKTFGTFHKSCCIEFDKYFYSPLFIKECSLCSTKSPFWVVDEKSDSIVCSLCLKKEEDNVYEVNG